MKRLAILLPLALGACGQDTKLDWPIQGVLANLGFALLLLGLVLVGIGMWCDSRYTQTAGNLRCIGVVSGAIGALLIFLDSVI